MKQQNKKVSKVFSSRQVGVLLESMHKDIKIVAEQHGDIMKKLEEHDKRVDTNEEMIASLAVDMTIVKSDIVGIKSDIVVIKSDVKVMKSDIVVIKNELTQKVGSRVQV